MAVPGSVQVRSLSSIRKDLNYVQHFGLEKQEKIQLYFHDFLFIVALSYGKMDLGPYWIW